MKTSQTTGPLYVECTGHRENTDHRSMLVVRTNGVEMRLELWRFLWCLPDQTVERKDKFVVIWDAKALRWRHCIEHCQLLYHYLHQYILGHSWYGNLLASVPCFSTNANKVMLFSFHFDGYVQERRNSIANPLMMTSSNGNIFRVTGHLCGEFTGPRWIPNTKASDAELWCFLWFAPE